MPSLLSDSKRSRLTGKMINFFDTFSDGRTVTIYKESTKTVNAPESSDLVYGYGDDQPSVSYTYEEVNRSFPAFIRYRKEQKAQENNVMENADFRFPESEVLVKIRQDAHEYIISGRTVKFVFDSANWTVVGGPRYKPFLSLPFYYYEVKRIV